jgi:hypothetical protein
MAKITDEMKDIIRRAKIFAVATVSSWGEPNVVPIAFGKLLSEDEILLVDVFMKKTKENIEANSKVAVSVWTTNGASKGYQFKGSAKIETSGKAFDEGLEMVKAAEPGLNPKAAVIVKVDSIYLISPGHSAGKQIG